MASITGTAPISPLLRLKNQSLGRLNLQKAGLTCTKKKNIVIRAVMTPTQPQQRSPASTGSVKHAMTMTEKILARAAEKSILSPGKNVWVNVDTLMTHDVCGPGTIGIFKEEFGPQAKVWDREKIVIIPDHYIFTNDERANRNVDIIRDFALEQNIKYYYDIKDRSDFRANPDYKGVCHIALAQEGHCKPGEVLFGTDSHTCNAGAFGQFATGIGNTDAGFIMGTGKLLIKAFEQKKQGGFQQKANVAEHTKQKESAFYAFMAERLADDVKSSVWYIDSGASRHYTHQRDLFTNFSPCIDSLKLVGGEEHKVVGTGTIQIQFGGRKLIFPNVYYVPNFEVNLLSVSQIIRHSPQLVVLFVQQICSIFDLEANNVVAFGIEEHGLYRLVDAGDSTERAFGINNMGT